MTVNKQKGRISADTVTIDLVKKNSDDRPN